MKDFHVTAYQRALAERLAAVGNNAISVAAGLIGQAKGDVTEAREIAGQAWSWLCDVDPKFHRPALADGLLLTCEADDPIALRAAVTAAEGRLVELQAAADAMVADESARADAADARADEWEAKLREASDKLADAAEAVAAADTLRKQNATLAAQLRESIAAAEGYERQHRDAMLTVGDLRGKLRDADAELALLRSGAVPLVADPVPVVSRPSMPSPAAIPAAVTPVARTVAPAADGGAVVRPASIPQAQWDCLSPAMQAHAARQAARKAS